MDILLIADVFVQFEPLFLFSGDLNVILKVIKIHSALYYTLYYGISNVEVVGRTK